MSPPPKKKMKKTITILIGILILSVFVRGSIVVQGITEEIKVERGQIYEQTFIIKNTGNTDVAMRLFLKDVIFSEKGKLVFEEPGTHSSSNSNWINLEIDYFLIPGGKAVRLPYRIVAPLEAESGSYWSMIFIEEVAEALSTKGMGVRTNLGYGVMIKTVVGKCHEGIVISNIEFDKQNYLKVILKNNGSKITPAKVKVQFNGKVSKVEVGNIYPGYVRLASFNLEELLDGEHVVRISVEVEDKFFGQKYSFYKGEKPKPKKIATLPERQTQAGKRKPYKLYLSFDYGSSRWGFSLAGRLRVNKKFNISASSNYNDNFLTDNQLGYRVSLNYKPNRWFSVGFGTYVYNDRFITAIRSSLNFKTTRIAIGHQLERNISSFTIQQRLSKYIIRIYGIFSKQRNEFTASFMIPIL